MTDIFEGYKTEVLKNDHSQRYPSLGLAIEPIDTTPRDHVRTIIDRDLGAAVELERIVDKTGLLIFRNMGLVTAGLEKRKIHGVDANQPFFFHSDYQVTEQKYTTLETVGGPRISAETCFGDRAVLRPALLEFFSKRDNLAQYLSPWMDIAKSRNTVFDLETMVDLFLNSTNGPHDLMNDFVKFIGDRILRFKLRAGDFVVFSNAYIGEDSGLLHGRAKLDDVPETTDVVSMAFSNFRDVWSG
ncbi:MAG: hypothetical protein AAB373_00145 [Patescibacteria group bacterium]